MHPRAAPTPLLLFALLALVGCASGPGLGLATSGAGHLSPPVPESPSEQAGATPTRPHTDRAGWGTEWCFDAGAPMTGAPALGEHGEVYVATHEGYVHALSADGAFRWSYTLKGSAIGGPRVLPSGAVVVATNSQLLYALKPNGTRLWAFRVPEAISTDIHVSPKGTVVFGAADRILYALSPYGGVMWRIGIQGGFTTAPQVVSDGLVAFGTSRGVLLVRGPNRQKLIEAEHVRQVLAGPETQGYGWALAEARVVALSGETFALPDAQVLGHSPRQGQLLAATSNELLWLDSSGKAVRRVSLPAAASDEPAEDSQGTTYLPTNDGRVLVANPSASEFQEFARVGSSSLSAPLLDEPRARLLVAAGEGTVCSVRIENSDVKTSD